MNSPFNQRGVVRKIKIVNRESYLQQTTFTRIVLVLVPMSGDTQAMTLIRLVTRIILAVYSLGLTEVLIRRTLERVKTEYRDL